jgi:hypothetical protein
MRGYEWNDIIEASILQNDEIFEKELIQWKYPSDEEIERVGVRGIFISNFFKWDANEHGPLMIEKYGFKEADFEFERTYRKMSNLDDMHENGIHDYMKWIKFGYGRATDHTTKDIRGGAMTREEGIKEVLKRDPIRSKDIERWLEYTGWTDKEFDTVADSFRDPRVWWIKNNEWRKKDIDGIERSYGPISLASNQIKKYFQE